MSILSGSRLQPLALLWLLFALMCSGSNWIEYPSSGFASLTHYTLPSGFVASCGCVPPSTNFPTAALSQMAYGSSESYGPGCGRCFSITLLNTFLSSPPWFPNVSKSVVVKVTDLCPISASWCNATQRKPNRAGHSVHFDLAWPSIGIPSNFFPVNTSYYGYGDFGVWNVSYMSVPCSNAWAGSSNISNFGAVQNLGSSVCCPSDPFTSPNTTCGSYSDQAGIPPESAPGTKSSSPKVIPRVITFVVPTCLISLAILML